MDLADGDPLVPLVLARPLSRPRSVPPTVLPATAAATDAFADRIGYRFADPALLIQALTHSSAGDARREAVDSNERLEFIGDRVLALLMAEWVSERFPAEREGGLTKRLAVLVAGDTLAQVGEALGLTEVLRVPAGEQRAGLRRRAKVLADATEALLGAIYLDGGLAPARALVRREWAALVEADPRPPMSAKSRLQEWSQHRALGLPTYRTVASSGPAHGPIFIVAATVAGREAEGIGDNKQAAEQAAAAALLALMERA